jgi:hypothetical protein
MGTVCSTHDKDVHRKFRYDHMKERLLGRPRRRWEDIKMDRKERQAVVWTGLIWLRIGASDELLSTWQ